jgi:hypothetical protein
MPTMTSTSDTVEICIGVFPGGPETPCFQCGANTDLGPFNFGLNRQPVCDDCAEKWTSSPVTEVTAALNHAFLALGSCAPHERNGIALTVMKGVRLALDMHNGVPPEDSR